MFCPPLGAHHSLRERLAPKSSCACRRGDESDERLMSVVLPSPAPAASTPFRQTVRAQHSSSSKCTVAMDTVPHRRTAPRPCSTRLSLPRPGVKTACARGTCYNRSHPICIPSIVRGRYPSHCTALSLCTFTASCRERTRPPAPAPVHACAALLFRHYIRSFCCRDCRSPR